LVTVAFPGPKGRVGHPDLTQNIGQNRARPPAARRGGLALPQSTRDPQNPERATSWPTPGSDRDRVDCATPAASHLDPARTTLQAPHDHRGRRCPRARRVLLGDHPNRIATR